ncbi:hypothetical protein H6F90_21740 [Trichocoleus sp. FACHB-591]|uniref:CRISPR-associated protein Csx18 n=1 Tax=Trichocoleus sp. FACHB-591 TaxID=2692872 RepID=UPI0016889362|nr:CRISPR-associated protein Csx18 [Trichocoleus sp. FACHB-591]MBD2097722.1 hypothetical protein [Trichocoleus sp. FACHB-591]
MYFSPRAAQVRNTSVAAVNGAITLVILLIAPLGLAVVIINTLLVTVATYTTAIVADRVVYFLQPERQQAELISQPSQSSPMQPANLSDINRI